jgi:hypothetical protein
MTVISDIIDALFTTGRMTAHGFDVRLPIVNWFVLICVCRAMYGMVLGIIDIVSPSKEDE